MLQNKKQSILMQEEEFEKELDKEYVDQINQKNQEMNLKKSIISFQY